MRFKILLLGFFILFIHVSASDLSAHELIPKEAIEYIKFHPDATTEEIQQFIEQKSPGYSRKFKSKKEAIEVITNKKTNFFDNAWDFLTLGIKHIMDGKDHILFVLSLLLTVVSVKEIIRLTGTFTLAHSLTLILAGADIIKLSGKIVEPVIAFSIAYVAITTVLLRDKTLRLGSFDSPTTCSGSLRTKLGHINQLRFKLFTVFFFGLFHGLGFAGLLREIQVPKDKFFSSLISFNIGIEIGQVIIVALILPAIYLLKKRVWYDTFIKIVAGAITIIALFWGVERIIS
jgi:hypothetical protein